ncbi:Cytosol aminopeptidase PepA [hydrothermal vent metagenome]|uniref:leucyl aminopeptidase n=1 Tax=hydrothermal vent metagenome TaxID=652676 RepID=A0A3B1C033_9ZZZZ
MIFNITLSNTAADLSKKSNSLLLKIFSDKQYLKKELDNFLSSKNIILNSSLKKNFLSKEKQEVKFINHSGKPDQVILTKLFADEKFDVDKFRDLMSKLVIGLKDDDINFIQVELPDNELFKKFYPTSEYFYQTFVEGIHLGNYTFDKYKSEKKSPKKLSINFNNSDKNIKTAIKTGEQLLSAVDFAKDLSNEPAITLTPAELLKRTKKELLKLGVQVTALNKAELKKRKMNSLLAVAEGSDNPPYLIILKYKPAKKSSRKIALVGKGVTYDSGGYSIKPTDSMIEMNGDMAGASAVIGTIMAAAKLKLSVELIGVIPAVENMISGRAYKPGDIISTASGKTIEVKNTDAEGRLILADALEYASKLKPDEILDFATLTGACVVALGEFTAGLLTKNDTISSDLKGSGEKTFERIWQLPFWDDFSEGLKSDIADTSNLGPRWGGAITAGKFLEKFVDEKIPWAHIDLAGPALKHKFRSYTEKYNTGFGVRLMIDYLSKK